MTKEKLPKGFVDTLPERETCDAAQEDMISEFVKTYLDASNIPDCYSYLNTTATPEEDKRIVGYKYLMARKWKMEDASKMFKDTVQWRESHKYHENPYFPSAILLRGYDQHMLETLFKSPPRNTNDRVDKIVARVRPGYKFSIHKWDKFGHPVIIDLTGRLHAKKTVAALKELAPPGEPLSEPFVLLRAYQNELCQFLIRSQDAIFQQQQRDRGVPEPLRRVTSVTGIMDMSGLSMDHLSSELIEAIKQMLSSTQAYYPEMSYRTFIVNCSSVVMFAFNIIKGWMDPRARNKLVFCSVEETPHVLRSVIDAENLPKFLGGECVCEGGCVCGDTENRSATAGGGAATTATSDEKKESRLSHHDDDHVAVYGEDPDKTVEIHVAARASQKRDTTVAKGDTFSWHWDIPHEGHDIEFSVTFTATGGAKAETLVAPTKIANNKSEVVAPADGVLSLVFSNEHAWMKGKTIRIRVAKTSSA